MRECVRERERESERETIVTSCSLGLNGGYSIYRATSIKFEGRLSVLELCCCTLWCAREEEGADGGGVIGI